jgi:hypothetical protein
VVSIVNDLDLMKELRLAQSKDKTIQAVKNFLEKWSMLPAKLMQGFEDYTLADGVLMRKGLVYVPDDKLIKESVLESCHDSKTAGHLGRAKTLELVSRDFWWPSMRAYVNVYVDGCDLCQRTKARTEIARGPLMPLEVPQGPWQSISYDFVVGLPESHGYDSILNIVDRFTKMAHFIPCHEDANAKQTTKLFIDHVFT